MEARRTEQSTGVPFASSLAAAALDGLFDHPAGCSDAVPDLLEFCVAPVPKGFFNNLLVDPLDWRFRHLTWRFLSREQRAPCLQA